MKRLFYAILLSLLLYVPCSAQMMQGEMCGTGAAANPCTGGWTCQNMYSTYNVGETADNALGGQAFVNAGLSPAVNLCNATFYLKRVGTFSTDALKYWKAYLYVYNDGTGNLDGAAVASSDAVDLSGISNSVNVPVKFTFQPPYTAIDATLDAIVFGRADLGYDGSNYIQGYYSRSPACTGTGANGQQRVWTASGTYKANSSYDACLDVNQ